MPAFVIVDIEIHDQELYKKYTQLTPATIEAFGGKFKVRGGSHKVLEGDWQPNRVVVLEFPTAKAAQDWWDSEEYAKARKIRQQAASTNMIIVEGL